MFPETISEKLSDAVIEQAMKLTAEDRQELVVSYAEKSKELWLVQGAEGFVMFEGEQQVQLPIFPHKDLTDTFISMNGIEGQSVSITLDEFKSTWLPGLEKNGVELVMFPTTSDAENLVMTASNLLAAFDN